MRWLPLVLAAATTATAAQTNGPAWRADFDALPAGSKVEGKPGTATATFEAASADGAQVLLMKADRATGSLMIPVKGIDLNRTPILRWRWAVTTLPAGADGRDPKKDDQAIGIYIGSGGMLSRKSVAYRWETDTPVGAEGDARYGAGVVRIRWFALRNKDGGTNAFVVEERNVAEDYRKAFGKVPDEIALSVSCNSQYTGTKAAAMLDWIEFVAAPAAASNAATAAKTPAP